MAAHLEPRPLSSSHPALRFTETVSPLTTQDDSPRPSVPSFTQFSPLNYSDPLLCVTPEKTQLKSSNRRNHALNSSKGTQKVRFDSTVEIKQLSPAETSTEYSNQSTGSVCEREGSQPEDVSSSSLFKDSTLQTDSSLPESTLPQSDLSWKDLSSLQLTDSSQTTDSTYSTIESEDVDFVDVIASDIEKREMDLIYGRKKTAKTKSSYVVRASVWGEDGAGDNVLARPEFNSTIMMRKELEVVKDSTLNVDEAVKRKLKAEDKTRTKLQEKASQRLNVTSAAQYRQLVSIEVREEDLLESAARQKASKVSTQIKTKPKPEDSIQPPDIMEFFTSNLQREVPSFTIDGVPKIEATPKTADLDQAFGVYRHIRAWEGW